MNENIKEESWVSKHTPALIAAVAAIFAAIITGVFSMASQTRESPRDPSLKDGVEIKSVSTEEFARSSISNVRTIPLSSELFELHNGASYFVDFAKTTVSVSFGEYGNVEFANLNIVANKMIQRQVLGASQTVTFEGKDGIQYLLSILKLDFSEKIIGIHISKI